MFLCPTVMCCFRPLPLASSALCGLRKLPNLMSKRTVSGRKWRTLSISDEQRRSECGISHRSTCKSQYVYSGTYKNYVTFAKFFFGNSTNLCKFQDTFCISKEIHTVDKLRKIQLTCNHCQRNYSSAANKTRTTLKKSATKAKSVKESLEETVREWKEDIVLTVPNALTSLRIVLTPFLGYLVIHESYSWACGLFVVAGLTDLLDGYIARTFPSQASVFGSYLDPLADKLLVSVLFLSLTVTHLIPLPLTVLVITRDVLLITAAFYIRYLTLPPPKTIKRYFDVTHATAQLHPTFISKLNTAVQLFLVTASLGAPVFGYVDHTAMHALWYVTAGTTIASGVTYMFAKNTFKILRETRKKKA